MWRGFMYFPGYFNRLLGNHIKAKHSLFTNYKQIPSIRGHAVWGAWGMRCVGLAPHNNHVQATPHEGGNIAKKVMWGVIII